MAGEQEPANADGAGTEQVQAGIGLAELDRTACLRLLADS
jgi:hypothetical protein